MVFRNFATYNKTIHYEKILFNNCYARHDGGSIEFYRLR